MTANPRHRLAPRWAALAALATCTLAAVPAALQAASPPAAATAASAVVAARGAEADYREARAVCLSGNSPQDRATCLKEAGAVRAERRAGRAGEPESAATLLANALKRCEVQPLPARGTCERLARGEGSREGAVASGGVLKQITTPIPAAAASATR